MNFEDAVEICEEWLAHLRRQKELTVKMQELAAKARRNPDSAEECRFRLRRLTASPTVFDAERLRQAIKRVIEELAG